MQAFIAKFGLDRIVAMPKLEQLQFQFATDERQVLRHRLCNPLWRWAMGVMKQNWGTGEVFVSTNIMRTETN